jgi:transposase-like protein
MKDKRPMSEPVIESKQTRKKFDKAFKQRAVELWLSSGRTATEVATELGIHPQRLSAWRRRFAPPPPGGEGTAIELTIFSIIRMYIVNTFVH